MCRVGLGFLLILRFDQSCLHLLPLEGRAEPRHMGVRGLRIFIQRYSARVAIALESLQRLAKAAAFGFASLHGVEGRVGGRQSDEHTHRGGPACATAGPILESILFLTPILVRRFLVLAGVSLSPNSFSLLACRLGSSKPAAALKSASWALKLIEKCLLLWRLEPEVREARMSTAQ